MAQPGHVQHIPAVSLPRRPTSTPAAAPSTASTCGPAPRWSYDPWDGTHLNANTAVLARSGSGKSFATKLGVLRGLCRGVTAYVIDPEGEYADMARAAGRTRSQSRRARRGHEPLCHRQGRLRGDAAKNRQPETPHRGHGGRESRRRAQGIPRPRPGGLLRPAQGAHRLPRLLLISAGRRGGRSRSRKAAEALCHRQPETPPVRRGRRPAGQRGPGDRLRPAIARTGAASRRRNGLHRDGVGRSRPGPQAPSTGGGRGVEHHAAPRGRGLHGQHGEAGEEAPAGGSSSSPRTCRTSSPRTPPRTITGHSGRALLQNAAFKLLLQQDAAAISTVGDAFDLPEDLQRWLLSCPRGDGLLLARGNRFPVRIEATPEETEVIEWRPGRH